MYQKSAKHGRISKERVLPCALGSPRNDLYRARSGTAFYGDPAYTKRLDPEYIRKLYSESRHLASTHCAYMDVYGREAISGMVGNRRGMNNVLHVKLQAACYPYLVMFKGVKYYYFMDFWRTAPQRPFAPSIGETAAAYAVGKRPGSDTAFSARAYWSMRPKFVGQVSLINSIFELKDFKDVLHISKVMRQLKKAVSSPLISDSVKEFRRVARESNIHATMHERGIQGYAGLTPDVLGDLARDSSGAAATTLLAINLALKPTISDVMAIAAQFSTAVHDAQDAFAQYGELGTTSHFSERAEYSSLVRGSNNYHSFSSGRTIKQKRTATMRSRYNYIPRATNEALRKYWGLSGTVEALWNMLPLSFVLDYILSIGKVLKYMDYDKNVVNLSSEYCESVLTEVTDGYHIHSDSTVPNLIIDGKYYKPSSSGESHILTGTQCTRYERKVMEPYKGPAIPLIKLPSKQQTANVLALVRCFLN